MDDLIDISKTVFTLKHFKVPKVEKAAKASCRFQRTFKSTPHPKKCFQVGTSPKKYFKVIAVTLKHFKVTPESIYTYRFSVLLVIYGVLALWLSDFGH